LEETLREFFPDMGGGSPPSQSKKPKRILFLAANPLETDRLRIDEEVREIKQRAYELQTEWAVRITHLSLFLLKYEPVIVHFSGHGSPTGDIVLQDESGAAAPLALARLVGLFEILKGSTECVALNACYSDEKARVLAKHVGCVIGMGKSIGDHAALRFSAGFFRGLAFGKSYADAFRLGCNDVDLAAVPDAAVPHFTTRDDDRVPSVTAGGGARSIELEATPRTWVPLGKTTDDASDSPRLYEVYFGTDRRPNDAHDLTRGCSNQRADDDVVYRGVCSIPKSHKFGSVGSAWWKRYATLTDDRLQLRTLLQMQEAAFWASAREALTHVEVGQKVALVRTTVTPTSWRDQSRTVSTPRNCPDIPH
jgi:hypothetical protein